MFSQHFKNWLSRKTLKIDRDRLWRERNVKKADCSWCFVDRRLNLFKIRQKNLTVHECYFKVNSEISNHCMRNVSLDKMRYSTSNKRANWSDLTRFKTCKYSHLPWSVFLRFVRFLHSHFWFSQIVSKRVIYTSYPSFSNAGRFLGSTSRKSPFPVRFLANYPLPHSAIAMLIIRGVNCKSADCASGITRVNCGFHQSNGFWRRNSIKAFMYTRLLLPCREQRKRWVNLRCEDTRTYGLERSSHRLATVVTFSVYETYATEDINITAKI